MRNRKSFYIGLVALLILLSLAQALTTTAHVKEAALGTQNITEVKLMASDGARYDEFGTSVSISDQIAVVGVPYDDDHGLSSGAALIYRWNGSNWQEEAKLTASDGMTEDNFGMSVSVDGDLALIGASNPDDYGAYPGAAYLFRWNGSQWQEEAKLLASDSSEGDYFGASVSVSGDIALVGAYGDDENGNFAGAAYLYRFDGSGWQEEQKLLSSGGEESRGFGRALSVSGDVALVGAYIDSESSFNSGAAYIYRWNGEEWQEEQKLLASDGAYLDHFGFAVSISGNTALVGTNKDDYNHPALGSAYIYRFDGSGWQEQARLEASDGLINDGFGSSLSISGDLALIGTGSEERVPHAAYLFEWNGSNWVEVAKLLPNDEDEGHFFGHTVSISDDMALIGAPQDDDQIVGSNNGSAYLYNLSPGNVPDLTLSVNSIKGELLEGTSISETVTLRNDGTEPLEWAINESLAAWYSVAPLSGTLSARDSTTVGIVVDASLLTSGRYTETVAITSNDPDEPIASVSLLHYVRRRTTDIKLFADDSRQYGQFGQALAVSGDIAIVGAARNDGHEPRSGTAYIYRWDGSSWTDRAKLMAHDGTEDDYFGRTVSINGDLALVGAWGPHHSPSGAAYIYRWNGSSWQEEAKLTIKDDQTEYYLGASVAIKGDLAVVGASLSNENPSASGLAYIFRWNGESWQEEAILSPDNEEADDRFGRAVSLSDDVVLVGASGDEDNKGAVYIFRWDGSDWQKEDKLTISEGEKYFGTSLSLSDEMALIGTSSGYYSELPGAAYLFRWTGSDWQEESKLTASDGKKKDYFGRSVSLNGDMALIGASGAAYLFGTDDNLWQEEAKLLARDTQAYDGFGRSVSISNQMALVGAPFKDDNIIGQQTGAAYLYNLSPGSVPDINLLPSSIASVVVAGERATKTLTIKNNGKEQLSWSISHLPSWIDASPISGTIEPDSSESVTILFDATNLNIGHHESEYLIISSNDPDEASLSLALLPRVIPPESKLLPSDGAQVDGFGSPVSVSGDVAIVGAIGSDDNGPNSGAAVIFSRNGSSWQEEAIVKASNGEPYEQFGRAVAISGDVAVVAANANDYYSLRPGTAYIFRKNGGSWEEEAILTADETEPRYRKFGTAVAISGNVAVVTAHDDPWQYSVRGAAYIFRWNGSRWNKEAILTISDQNQADGFGTSVSISGNLLLIGDIEDSSNGENSGAAYLYRWDGESWQQEAKLIANDSTPGADFGTTLSISGNTALIGARRDGDNGNRAAYIYRFDGQSWNQEAKLLASDSTLAGAFGSSVSINGNAALVGALQDNENGSDAGAAYLYHWNGESWQEVSKLWASDGRAGHGFGKSVSISGPIALIGSLSSVYAYELPFDNSPDINISAMNVSLTLSPGEQATGTLTITNHSSDTLAYSLTEDAAWLDITPQNGSIAPQNSQKLTSSIDATTLKAGSYSQILTLSTNHPDYESVAIPVTVTVAEPTSITLSGLSVSLRWASVAGALGLLILSLLMVAWANKAVTSRQ